jgi:hypothetical protein
MPAIDIELVCTHQHLIDELGSAKRLNNVLPVELGGDTTSIREAALEDVLIALGRRRPPVHATDLVHPEELRRAVLYQTLERLFGAAQHLDEGAWGAQRTRYEKRLRAELQGLAPTIRDGMRAPSGIGIAVFRR